jgi:hypothetical protein
MAGFNMKTASLLPMSTFLSLILSLVISCQHHAQAVQVSESTPAKASPELAVVAKNPLPEISFEKTVCDLGQVGLSTKNSCEFEFTNTGPASCLTIARMT